MSPALPAAQAEIDGVIENVIGSAIEQAIKYERERIAAKAKGEKPKRKKPGARGYRLIMQADIAARGWGIQKAAANGDTNGL